ncbi:Rid family hydrolase [Oscillibacter sp.]|uniref:Rid family hydrolase n=1 Tax=Oscillibacter sp. TaxID=1945593 RepID=UPI002636664E|nr:Rid family hydrolase [Oscillibacter sp.]MDD3347717.1 Rid family hydrolase [Oscillibacter sp.]
MFRAHRNPYDRGLDLLGVKIVELGYPNNIDVVTEEGLENAITDKTVGLLYLPSTNGGWVPPGALELDKTIAICKKHDIPVVVDAAAQLPPKSNLWHFTTEMGASAVTFSGGKDIKGPQTTGLVLGKKDLLSWVNQNNFPNYGIGRMNKVGREELAGIYVALKQYVEHDEAQRLADAEEMVASFVDAFDTSDAFHFERTFPNEAGQPLPRAKLIITKAGLAPEEIRERLLNLPAPIFSMVENGHLYVNPYTIHAQEAAYILGVYKDIQQKGENLTMISIPEGAVQHTTAGPYSPVLEVSGFKKLVVISGQAPLDLEGKLIGDTIEEQTIKTLENCKAQLAKAGCTFENVFKVNAYMKDTADWPRFNAVYREHMAQPFPVRTAVGVSLLENFKIEIEMWAAI